MRAVMLLLPKFLERLTCKFGQFDLRGGTYHRDVSEREAQDSISLHLETSYFLANFGLLLRPFCLFSR